MMQAENPLEGTVPGVDQTAAKNRLSETKATLARLCQACGMNTPSLQHGQAEAWSSATKTSITVGNLLLAQDEKVQAGSLAHELAHIKLGHHEDHWGQDVTVGVLGIAGALLLTATLGLLVGLVFECLIVLAWILVEKKLYRRRELEADLEAGRILEEAGYEENGARLMAHTLKTAAGQVVLLPLAPSSTELVGTKPRLLRTCAWWVQKLKSEHPDIQTRVSKLELADKTPL